MLQADILTKAVSLKTQEQNANHTEEFEMGMWDQNKISGILDVPELWTSIYCQQKWSQNAEQISRDSENNETGTQSHYKMWMLRYLPVWYVQNYWSVVSMHRIEYMWPAERSAGQKVRTNGVLYWASRTRKPLWMTSLHMWYLIQNPIPTCQAMAMATKKWKQH